MRPIALNAVFAIVFASFVGYSRAQTVDLVPTAGTADFPRTTIPFTLEVDVHNAAGPGVATGVIVTNLLPPQLTLLSCTPATYVQLGLIYDGSFQYAQVSWTNFGNTIRIDAGSIPYGFHRPIFITAVASQPGTFNNQISVTGQGTDIHPGNNVLNYPIEVHTNSLFVVGGQSIVESSGSNATFMVVLSPPNSVPVTVDFSTLDGTALAGQDYQPVSGSLVFAPGVTNLPVSVPILDDSLRETESQSFSLRLTNAVNAEISGMAGSNYVLDDEPPLEISISNAPAILEGDGVTNLAFPIHLSGPADVPLQITFAATQGLTTNGVLAIPAGTADIALNLTVIGDVSVDSNRVVQVDLSTVSPLGTLGQTSAQGTILEDDGVPGKFHHMQISAVPSPQLAGRPFTITLSAWDYFNNPATNFFGPVEVDAYAITNYSGVFIQTLSVTNFVAGEATTLITYPNPATNAVIAFWKPVGTWYYAGLTPNFKVIGPPKLFTAPVGQVTEGDGLLPGAGRVWITNIDVQDVVVQLSSLDTEQVVVPPQVTIPAGQTNASFDVTILDDTLLDGPRGNLISLSATGYVGTTVAITVNDNESAALSLSLPSNLSELKGFSSGTATVFASAPPVQPILVTLSSSDTSELTLPGGVYIQAGQTSATFTVSVPDDTYVDGPQTVTVTAHVPNWIDGVASTVVFDNDTNLTVVIESQAPFVEGSGTWPNWLQIRAGGIVSNALVVQLSSSNPSRVSVPPEIIIPAGAQTVLTNITFLDNSLFDGSETITITASAPGFYPGVRTLSVTDDDVHHIVFGAIQSPRTSGAPFSVSINARDVNDAIIASYRGSFAIGALRNGQSISLSPTLVSNVIRGGWFGNVTFPLNVFGSNIQLVATATNGVSGLSSTFDVVPPAWVGALQLGRWQLEGNGMRVFFNSYTGHQYQVEVSTTLPPVWVPVGPPQAGTGAELSTLDPGSAASPMRFYRLSATP